MAPGSGATSAGSTGSGLFAGDGADVGGAVGAREHLRPVHLATRLLVLEEQRLGRHLAAGTRRPGCAPSDRTRPAVAATRAARIDQGPMAMTTASPSTTAPSTSTPLTRDPLPSRTMPVTSPEKQLRAPCASAARIMAAVNIAWMDLRRGIQSSRAGGPRHAIRQPIDSLCLARAPQASARARCPAKGGEAAIAPVAADHLRQLGVQGKAAPRQGLQAACRRTSRAPGSRPTCRTPRRQHPCAR